MPTEPTALPVIRRAELPGRDAPGIARLLEGYLTQTELEKAQHLGTAHPGELPARYRREVERPDVAFRDAVVHVTELDDLLVGLAVVQGGDEREIKRLWVAPQARGLGLGGALLDAAIAPGDQPLRLTVWAWREDAIRLYARRGFAQVASWDARPGLVCMVRRPEVTA